MYLSIAARVVSRHATPGLLQLFEGVQLRIYLRFRVVLLSSLPRQHAAGSDRFALLELNPICLKFTWLVLKRFCATKSFYEHLKLHLINHLSIVFKEIFKGNFTQD